MRNSIRWFCLEDNTERSESNQGQSLGIITKEKRAVWKTVPENMLLRLRLCPHALKEFTDNVDATDFFFSRISFCVATWYWIYYGLYLRLYGAGLPPARGNPSESQRPAGAEKSNNTIKIRERTNPSHQRYP